MKNLYLWTAGVGPLIFFAFFNELPIQLHKKEEIGAISSEKLVYFDRIDISIIWQYGNSNDFSRKKDGI